MDISTPPRRRRSHYPRRCTSRLLHGVSLNADTSTPVVDEAIILVAIHHFCFMMRHSLPPSPHRRSHYPRRYTSRLFHVSLNADTSTPS